jgi:hypothetical protein
MFEFGQITWDVFAGDGPVGAGDRRLYVTERGVDPFEGWRPLRISRPLGPRPEIIERQPPPRAVLV